MQRNFNLRLRSWPALAALLTVLATGCSTYEPLGSGSTVPWAKALRAGAEGEAHPWQSASYHKVAPGDHLSELALRYGVSLRALAEANRIEPPYIIYAGDRLLIPEGGAEPRPGQPAARRYVVKRGDSLSIIAERFDLTMSEIAALNRLKAPYRLYPGQSLHLPEAETAVARAAAPQTAAAQVLRSLKGEPPPLAGDGFLWPVNGKVIGGFGSDQRGARRDGIDIAARKGAPVLAAQDGVVVYAGDAIRGYGRMILLRHDEGYITTYAHNSALLVEVGDVVRRGQVIARVGDTGGVSRALLHFELRKGRKPLDPETVLVRDSTAIASTQ